MKPVISGFAAFSLLLVGVASLQAKTLEERRTESTLIDTSTAMGIPPQYKTISTVEGIGPQYDQETVMGIGPQYTTSPEMGIPPQYRTAPVLGIPPQY